MYKFQRSSGERVEAVQFLKIPRQLAFRGSLTEQSGVAYVFSFYSTELCDVGVDIFSDATFDLTMKEISVVGCVQ